MAIQALRAVEPRFAGISAYPYPAHTLVVEGPEEGGTRIAYLAEGPHEHHPILLVHGGPTWSYLWRRVVPGLAEAGCWVVAPDLLGFGRSDLPASPRELTAERQAACLLKLAEELELEDTVLVVHGFSAGIGARLVAAARRRFDALVMVCPILARRGVELDALVGRLREEEPLSAGALVEEGCSTSLPEVVRRAYEAPYGEDDPLAGLRALPGFLPDAEEWRERAACLDLPVLAVAGEEDPLGAEPGWLDALPAGPRRQQLILSGAGHHLPEDRGPELALAILDFIARL